MLVLAALENPFVSPKSADLRASSPFRGYSFMREFKKYNFHRKFMNEFINLQG